MYMLPVLTYCGQSCKFSCVKVVSPDSAYLQQASGHIFPSPWAQCRRRLSKTYPASTYLSHWCPAPKGLWCLVGEQLGAGGPTRKTLGSQQLQVKQVLDISVFGKEPNLKGGGFCLRAGSWELFFSQWKQLLIPGCFIWPSAKGVRWHTLCKCLLSNKRDPGQVAQLQTVGI